MARGALTDTVDTTHARLAALVSHACRLDVQSLKPGNVGVHGDGHGLAVSDFELSAEAIAPVISAPRLGVGERIERAIAATHAAVNTNTNLGIVLLLTPLMSAAWLPAGSGNLQKRLVTVLQSLSVDDAHHAYRAIRLANPGGMGTVRDQDVSRTPSVTLLEAMRMASERDRVAHQYASGYADVFGIGVPAWYSAKQRGLSESWAMSATYLAMLAAIPDSLISRKHGVAAAQWVQSTAKPLADRAQTWQSDEDATSHQAGLMAFDHALKARGWNPGTSADLCVAAVVADSLIRWYNSDTVRQS